MGASLGSRWDGDLGAANALAEPEAEGGHHQVGGVVTLVVAQPDRGDARHEGVEPIRPPVVLPEGFADNGRALLPQAVARGQ